MPLMAFALCGRPVQGWQVVTGSTEFGSVRVHRAQVACPSGKQVVGAGVAKDDEALGVARVDRMVLNTLTRTAYARGRYILGDRARSLPRGT